MHVADVTFLMTPVLGGSDSLHEMTDEEKLMVWNSREELWGHPKALPKILQSADWTDHYQLKQAVSYVLKRGEFLFFNDSDCRVGW